MGRLQREHGSVKLHQLRARRNCAASCLILGLASSPEVPVAAPNVPRQVPERKISGGPKVSRRWSSKALQPPHALRSRARKAVASFESKDRMRPPSRHVKNQAPDQGKAPDTSQVGCASMAMPGIDCLCCSGMLQSQARGNISSNVKAHASSVDTFLPVV